ncbi:MAG: hypothetical protein HY777_04445 [Betaproteobacteria bacterium]|nr:hypothetical protein [Betaproteobacteria bacterium]
MAIAMIRSIFGLPGTAVVAADHIASGVLVSKVPVGGSDEVGQLLARMGNMRQ